DQVRPRRREVRAARALPQGRARGGEGLAPERRPRRGLGRARWRVLPRLRAGPRGLARRPREVARPPPLERGGVPRSAGGARAPGDPPAGARPPRREARERPPR